MSSLNPYFVHILNQQWVRIHKEEKRNEINIQNLFNCDFI